MVRRRTILKDVLQPLPIAESSLNNVCRSRENACDPNFWEELSKSRCEVNKISMCRSALAPYISLSILTHLPNLSSKLSHVLSARIMWCRMYDILRSHTCWWSRRIDRPEPENDRSGAMESYCLCRRALKISHNYGSTFSFYTIWWNCRYHLTVAIHCWKVHHSANDFQSTRSTELYRVS